MRRLHRKTGALERPGAALAPPAEEPERQETPQEERRAAQSVRRGATPLGRPKPSHRPASGGQEASRFEPVPPATASPARNMAKADVAGLQMRVDALEASLVWQKARAEEAEQVAQETQAALSEALSQAEGRAHEAEREASDAVEARDAEVSQLAARDTELGAAEERCASLQHDLEVTRERLKEFQRSTDAMAAAHAQRVAMLEARIHAHQWRNLEQQVEELQSAATEAAEQHDAEVTRLGEIADHVPLLQERVWGLERGIAEARASEQVAREECRGKIVTLSRFVALSVSLTLKSISLLQR